MHPDNPEPVVPQEEAVPEGHHYEWRRDDSWVLINDHRRCRRPRCGKFGVAALKRSRKGGFGFAYWAYCADHMYGRKIDNGEVKMRCLVPNEPEAAHVQLC